MNITGTIFTANTKQPCTITTERAESSYGLPVVVVDGVAYGPADLGPHVLQIDSGFVTVAQEESDLQTVRMAGYNVGDQLARVYGIEDRWPLSPSFNELYDE